MNEALQAVLDYARTPGTDYALLITGPWGCGKTYFWKNVVEPKLRQMKCDGTPRRPLYASLYGCQSTKDIDTQLFLASHPHLRKKWTTRLSTVGGHTLKQVLKAFTGLELPAIDLRWLVNTKNAVLCFDDLERTRLPMKQALGYINSFVEHEGAKTVIVCNEEAISGEDDRKTYEKMKEKVVGFSLSFQADYHEALQSLVAEHRDDAAFSAFLAQHQELIGQLFHKSETHNIRTLRRVLAALCTVFGALKDCRVDPGAVARQVIYAVAPTALEFHAGRANTDTLRGIHALNMVAVAGVTFGDPKDEESYERGFVERYLPEAGWNEVIGCPPICEFVLTGFLDREALVQWAKALTKPLDPNEERIKRLSYDPRDMDDAEFERAAAEVLAQVTSGEITAAAGYVEWYDRFEGFANMHLIQMSRQELLETFTDGLALAEQAATLQGNEMLRHEIDRRVMDQQSEERRAIRQRVLEANENALKRGLRASIIAWGSRLSEDGEGFIKALTSEGDRGLLFVPVFHELDPNAVATWLIGLPNALKSRFAIALRGRYKMRERPEFAVELASLQRLRDGLKEEYEKSARKVPVPMSASLTGNIVVILDEIIEQLAKLVEPKETPSSESVSGQQQNGGQR